MMDTSRATNLRQAMRCSTVAAALTLVAVLCVGYSMLSRDARWRRNRVAVQQIAQSGDTVVAALDQYKAQHSRYPSDLRHLEEADRRLLPPQPPQAREYWQYSVEADE